MSGIPKVRLVPAAYYRRSHARRHRCYGTDLRSTPGSYRTNVRSYSVRPTPSTCVTLMAPSGVCET